MEGSWFFFFTDYELLWVILRTMNNSSMSYSTTYLLSYFVSSQDYTDMVEKTVRHTVYEPFIVGSGLIHQNNYDRVI